MLNRRDLFRPMLLALGFALVVALGARSTLAAETLRWKFKAGESLHYRMLQDTQIRAVAAETTSKTAIAQTIDMTWKVTEVDDKGTASMVQTIDRMRMKVTTPQGVLEVDSASKENSGPLGESIAPVFEALIGAPFKLRMTPTGEIEDVEVPASAIEALKKNPALGALMSADALKQMTTQASIPLPEEAVDVGAKWTKEKELSGVKLKITYTFAGDSEHDGRKLGKITTDAQLDFDIPKTEGVTAELEEGKMQGEMFFDFPAGQLVDSQTTQKMVISITGMGQSLRQEIQSLVGMKLVPPGEVEKPESEADSTEKPAPAAAPNK